MISISPQTYGVAHAAPLFECAKCGEQFTLRPGKPGKVNECEACSVEYVFPLMADDIPNALVLLGEGDDATRAVEFA